MSAPKGPTPHPAPLIYDHRKVHLDGDQACYIEVLGCLIWAATWAELKVKVDRTLGYEQAGVTA